MYQEVVAWAHVVPAAKWRHDGCKRLNGGYASRVVCAVRDDSYAAWGRCWTFCDSKPRRGPAVCYHATQRMVAGLETACNPHFGSTYPHVHDRRHVTTCMLRNALLFLRRVHSTRYSTQYHAANSPVLSFLASRQVFWHRQLQGGGCEGLVILYDVAAVRSFCLRLSARMGGLFLAPLPSPQGWLSGRGLIYTYMTYPFPASMCMAASFQNPPHGGYAPGALKPRGRPWHTHHGQAADVAA